MSALALVAAAGGPAAAKDAVPTKFLVFREDCFDRFIQLDLFSDVSCIKFSISKGIGYAIILGSLAFKVPQIKNILAAQSVKGLSAQSYYFETIVYINTLSYSRHLDLPFSVYGETISVLVQNTIVILLMYKFDKSIGMGEKVGVLGVLAVYAAVLVLDQGVPEQVWSAVSSSCILFNIMSRVPQIYQNFASKSTGVLAFATIFLAFAGSIARLGTVLVESDDAMYKL